MTSTIYLEYSHSMFVAMVIAGASIAEHGLMESITVVFKIFKISETCLYL